MPTSPPQRPTRRSRAWYWALGAFTIALLLVVATIVLDGGPDRETEPDGGPTATSASPTVMTEPHVVQGAVELTVPDTIHLASDSFHGEAGSTYLLQFEASTLKPEESPGAAMYFGANLACGGPEGGTLRSVGGTQNVRSGEHVSIRNQFLLEIDETGKHSCRITVNSPNPEAAAEGTTAEIDTRWTATHVDSEAFEAAADERLPRTVDSGERAAAFRYKVDLTTVQDRQLDVLSTLHLTTCTGTNGSREDGRTWCAEEDVDLEGSSLEVTYRADVLDSDGEVCDSKMLDTERANIERHTHHRVLHMEHEATDGADPCGDTLRFVVAVDNDGPAPVVIHRSNSTFTVIEAS